MVAAAVYSSLASSAETRQPATPPPVAAGFEAADRELIQGIVREGAIDTSVPRRGVMAYLAHLTNRLLIFLTDLLRPLGRYTQGAGIAVGRTAVAAALLTASVLLCLGTRSLLRRRRPRPASPPSSSALADPELPLRAWDTARWRQELQDRIERSDVAGSLEALWWWLARSLLGERVMVSWTSSDLLSGANRAGLKEPVRRLERMMYGSRRPPLDEVRDLLQSLERQLA